MLLGKYKKISYLKLNKKMQEAYNFQKASSILADYGFVTNLLKYDWMGADFLAQHIDGDWLKIQLKGRLTSDPKYLNKNIHIMFEDKNSKSWYLYPHDKFFEFCESAKPGTSKAKNGFSTGNPSNAELEWLKYYLIKNSI